MLMVSIIMPTYGHEKFIRQAIESVLMQEVNFSYELLIGEDASPDRSKEIIKEYEQRYPDKIKAFYRTENMNSNPEKYPWANSGDLKLRSQGKYLIVLEGDDFWTDPHKLQCQVDFLEQNPAYIGVAHNVCVVGEKGENIAFPYPECREEEYTIHHFRSDILPGQTASVLYRNFFLDRDTGQLKFVLDSTLGPGDDRTDFYLLSHGRIHCIQKQMSAYRYIISHGSSFSATNKRNVEKEWHHFESFMLYAYEEKLGKEFEVTGEVLFLRRLFFIWRRGDLSFREFLEGQKEISHVGRTWFIYLGQIFRREILRKKIYG